jgi:GT2 family glycosyltransferase
MISIIVCSRNAGAIDALRKNISQTIGIPHEFIPVVDSEHDNSIFRAYNAGLSMANYDSLCFVHDDVQFCTKSWGKLILKHLEEDSSGFIGIAGGPTVARIPADWSFDVQYKHLIQSDGKDTHRSSRHTGYFSANNAIDAVLLDGVFMCCKKKIFDEIRFDETIYRGFHCYDQDICLQAYLRGYKNKVVDNLSIIHYSKGKKDRHWVESQIQFWRKWRKDLPVSCTNIDWTTLPEKECRYLERSFSRRMIRNGYSLTEVKKIIDEYNQIVQDERGQKARFKPLRVLFYRLFAF